MKKRIFVFVLTAILCFAAIIFGAAAPKSRAVPMEIVAGENVHKLTCRVPLNKDVMRISKYKKSFALFCNNEFSGDEKGFLRYLDSEFYEELEEVCEKEYLAPQEPAAIFSADGFSYIDGKDGVKIDRKKLFSDVIISLDCGGAVIAEKKAVSPVRTVEELKKNTVAAATFRTDYSRSADGRKRNIELACERLNLSEIPSRGWLGFNATVGERTVENGFGNAKIILNGEYVEGIGGGVCQVSTTLYNAWLTAGYAVAASSNHSLPTSYVPPSLDAMVSSVSDLILYNDSDYPAYISALCDGKQIKITVYGRKPRYKIKLRSETVKIVPSKYVEKNDEIITWEEGEKSRIIKKAYDGVYSRAYREYFLGVRLIKSEKIKDSYYKVRDGEIVIRKPENAI
mgnify:CR=1 FL=1